MLDLLTMSCIEVRVPQLSALERISLVTFAQLEVPVIGDAIQLNYFFGSKPTMTILGVMATSHTLEVWREGGELNVQDAGHSAFSRPIPELVVNRRDGGNWVVDGNEGSQKFDILDERAFRHFIARVTCGVMPYLDIGENASR